MYTEVNLINFNYRTKEVTNQFKRDKADLKYLDKDNYKNNLLSLKADYKSKKTDANLRIKQYEKEVNRIPKHRLMAEYTMETNPDKKLAIRHRIDFINNMQTTGKVLKTAGKVALGTAAIAGLGLVAGTAVRAGMEGISAAKHAINDVKNETNDLKEKLDPGVKEIKNVAKTSAPIIHDTKSQLSDMINKYSNGATLASLNTEDTDPKNFEIIRAINDRAHEIVKSTSGVPAWSQQTKENEDAIKNAWDKAIPKALAEYKAGKIKI